MPGVYYEFIAQGGYVKVSAIDAESGIEVSMVGAVGTPQFELERLASRKLAAALRKRAELEKKSRPGTLA